jgi:hypothetical protein
LEIFVYAVARTLLIAVFVSTLCLLAPNVQAAAETAKSGEKTNRQRAVELTFLKSNPDDREKLKQFIVDNWFAMDAIAVKQGLMSAYTILETGDDAGDWNLIVKVTYPNERGYDGIQDEFNKIRQAHKTILVDGKGLRDLGRIESSKKTFEDVTSLKR